MNRRMCLVEDVLGWSNVGGREMMDGVDTGGSHPLLYLGSTGETCRGDGSTVRPLFMDHHPSTMCTTRQPLHHRHPHHQHFNALRPLNLNHSK